MPDILARVDATYRHGWRVISGGALDGETSERDGLLLVSSGLPIAWLNLAIITTPLPDPARAVDAAIAFFDERRLPFVVRMRDGLDPAAEAACTERRLPYSDTIPSLVMDPIPHAPPPPGGLDVRRCTTPGDLDAFRAITGASFEFPPEHAARLLPPPVLDEADCEFFVGFADGEPVASCALMVAAGIASVEMVGCLPQARRRGFGEAMTWHAVSRGRDRGCDVASLQASDMGRPIYERMGFRFLTGYRTFVRPGT